MPNKAEIQRGSKLTTTRHAIMWALTGWLILSGTLWLWLAGTQPSRFYTPGFNDALIFMTGVYALWVLCLRRKDVTALARAVFASSRGGLIISLMTTTLLCACVELSARWLLVTSDSYAIGAVQFTWFRAYWLPVNSLSIRDVEPYPAELTNVLIVGDSYVAGYGIENHSDMINRRLQEMLGAGYGVNIAADAGLHTVDEFALLQAYPTVPNLVVWSQHPNDITWLDMRPRRPLWLDARGMFEWLMGRTYVTEYIFIHRLNILQPAYEDELLADEAVWAQHTALLDEVVVWCDERSIPIVFVSWELWGMHYSPQFVAWAENAGVPYIDMADLYDSAESFSEVAASPLDGHPNEQVIQILAERIYEWMTTTR